MKNYIPRPDTGEKDMTPCEEKGYKVGDRFRVLEEGRTFSKGSIVELYRDDMDKVPFFKLISGEIDAHYACISNGVLGSYMELRGMTKVPNIPEASIPKGVITAQKLRELALNSGLQVEFRSGGEIYVWDDIMEAQARLDNVDEYIELAEAKIEYQKVWCKYTWE